MNMKCYVDPACEDTVKQEYLYLLDDRRTQWIRCLGFYAQDRVAEPTEITLLIKIVHLLNVCK